MVEIGTVVKSIAGHDKDSFYVVVGMEKDCVYIADGRARKLEKPKRKNIRHIRPTGTILDSGRVATNKKLRSALGAFQQDAAAAERQEGGNEICPRRMS